MDAVVAPQIITAVATLAGVALTVGANWLNERRKAKQASLGDATPINVTTNM
jgi:hypothetical protein